MRYQGQGSPLAGMKNYTYWTQNQNLQDNVPEGRFSFIYMKKFLVFISFLLLLITCEYFLVNEMFTQKRPAILVISLLGSVVFIFAAYRFFKKYFLSTKQAEGQS
jgi:hypothetical protein